MNENRPPALAMNEVHTWDSGTPWDVAVVIPAQNEATHIEGCMLALADAVAQSHRSVGVVLCVNDTGDDTAIRAAAILRMRGVAHLIFNLSFPAGTGGVGRARDIGMKLSQRIAGPPATLMTTDADSHVCPDWIAANLTALDAADIVFGTVLPKPDELSRLDPKVARHDARAARYMAAALQLIDHLDPLPHDPAPSHRASSGASIALTAKAFAQLGGVPWCHCGEGHALSRKAEALDLRIRHAGTPRVFASCRLIGRAPGGMANRLRRRSAETDPYCDDWLEPAADLIRRYRAKGSLRGAWPSKSGMLKVSQHLLGAGHIPDLQNFTAFGDYWQNLEAMHPALARKPLRQSDALREYPLLKAALQQFEAPPPDHPARCDGDILNPG